MNWQVKILALILLATIAVSVGVYAYHLMRPRSSLLVYPHSRITGCRDRLNETIMLHVKNSGTVNLYINACNIYIDFGVSVTYFFERDIEALVGVEALIIFPAGGGTVLVETVLGSPSAMATGGEHAISDNSPKHIHHNRTGTAYDIHEGRANLGRRGDAHSP